MPPWHIESTCYPSIISQLNKSFFCNAADDDEDDDDDVVNDNYSDYCYGL